ncbi:hypothetical protein AgCh_000605 [Apium graveolens]
MCLIRNFTVQKYKDDDNLCPVHSENQLIFSADTLIKHVKGKGEQFEKDTFDFYDHGELDQLADKILYLIDKVDSSNVVATHYYLNSNHHSVHQITKMLATTEYTQKMLNKQKRKKSELLTVAAIKSLGAEYVQAHAILHTNIRYVEETDNWFFTICMECKGKLNLGSEVLIHRFQLSVVISDVTGALEIFLEDEEVRILTGTRAEQSVKITTINKMNIKDVGIKIPFLDKDNYHHWKVKMHLHLFSQDEAYVDCIEKGPHVPMRAATENEASVPKPPAE